MNSTEFVKSASKPDGKIGIYYLKEIWLFYLSLRASKKNIEKVSWKYLNGVLNTLALGLEPTVSYLTQYGPSFEEFEDWILAQGRVSKELINQFNLVVEQKNDTGFVLEEEILDAEDLAQWQQDGYVIVKEAISKEDCAETVNLIYNAIEADPERPESWYKHHDLKKGIMLQLFNSPILDRNRLSRRIRLAFEQLYKRTDLLVSNDRVSFNPPETENYVFPGPNLHWDVSLKQPIPYGMQGLLYLSDTERNQGAFTVIPGFHNFIDEWLSRLPPQQYPRDKKLLEKFAREPIGAKAGDFIIWNHCLPHGSSPNTSDKPRIVQYINYQPLNMDFQEEWI